MRWTLCSDDARVATMAAEKAILCVLFEEFLEPDEIGINTCLKNTLNVQSLPLSSRIKENIPIEWRDLWKLWFLIIVIQHLPRISGWKDKHFRWRIIHFLPLRLLWSTVWPYYFYCEYIYIYIYAFSRRFYPNYSGYTFFLSVCRLNIIYQSIRLIIIADHCCCAMIL